MKIAPKEWNDFMIERRAPFLQSWEWGSLNEKLGRRLVRFSGSSFTSLLIENRLVFRKNYFYAPRGPVPKNDSDFSRLGEFAREIRGSVSNINAVFLRLEPALALRTANIYEPANFLGKSERAINELKIAGYVRTEPVQPETTLVLDLTQSEEGILEGMEHDTRYAIRAAERRGVKILRLKDQAQKVERFKDFWDVFKATQARHRLKSYSKAYYQRVAALDGECRSEIYLGLLDKETICAALLIFFGTTATYLYSGSRGEFGRYNAPTRLLWEAILAAKSEGCARFDFWGINEKKKKWAGLTAYKKSFGGQEVKYAGTWDYPFDRKWYLLYELAHRLKTVL